MKKITDSEATLQPPFPSPKDEKYVTSSAPPQKAFQYLEEHSLHTVLYTAECGMYAVLYTSHKGVSVSESHSPEKQVSGTPFHLQNATEYAGYQLPCISVPSSPSHIKFWYPADNISFIPSKPCTK